MWIIICITMLVAQPTHTLRIEGLAPERSFKGDCPPLPLPLPRPLSIATKSSTCIEGGRLVFCMRARKLSYRAPPPRPRNIPPRPRPRSKAVRKIDDVTYTWGLYGWNLRTLVSWKCDENLPSCFAFFCGSPFSRIIDTNLRFPNLENFYKDNT